MPVKWSVTRAAINTYGRGSFNPFHKRFPRIHPELRMRGPYGNPPMKGGMINPALKRQQLAAQRAKMAAYLSTLKAQRQRLHM